MGFLKKTREKSKLRLRNENREMKKTGENVDKFEELHKEWAKVPASKQMKMDEAKKTECTCPKCPTYTSCAKNAHELLFCMKGKSFMCISEDKGCICPSCPVTSEYGLKNKFFCLKGAEKAQRYEHTLWGTKIV